MAMGKYGFRRKRAEPERVIAPELTEAHADVVVDAMTEEDRRFGQPHYGHDYMTGTVQPVNVDANSTNKEPQPMSYDANDNADFLTIDPKLGDRPVLPAGDYEGILDRCDVRDSRFQERNPGMKADHFEVVVRRPEFGIVRLFSDKDRSPGTIAVKWYTNLGVTREEMVSGFSPSKLSGTPVLVTVGVRDYTNKDGDRVETNTIRNIVRIQ